jgi:hypothetical protein
VARWAAGLLGFIAGLVGGYALSIAAYAGLTSAGLLFDRDGGIGMAFAFAIGPVVAIVCAIFAAVWAARRWGRPRLE